MSRILRARVPATSANLGPGFDCMGVALDLWNEFSLSAAPGDGITVTVEAKAPASFRWTPATSWPTPWPASGRGWGGPI
jgi:homoserine kinase